MSARQNDNIPAPEGQGGARRSGQANRPAESQGASLGSQQQDDQGGIGGQGLGNTSGKQRGEGRREDASRDTAASGRRGVNKTE